MSRLTRSVIVVVLGLFLVAGSARASQVVFGNLGNDGTTPLALATSAKPSSSTWVAHGFTVGGTNNFLNSVSVGIFGSGSATVALYSSSAGSPGSFITSVSQSIANLTTPTLQSFNFGGFSLTNATPYWIVVSGSSSTPFDWSFNADGDFPIEQNGSGWAPLSPVTRQSDNSGTNWTTAGVNRPASISITASSTAPAPEPIPEPGTWAAAALLIGAAAYVRWRRRPQAA
jgi:hypothetical protein